MVFLGISSIADFTAMVGAMSCSGYSATATVAVGSIGNSFKADLCVCVCVCVCVGGGGGAVCL